MSLLLGNVLFENFLSVQSVHSNSQKSVHFCLAITLWKCECCSIWAQNKSILLGSNSLVLSVSITWYILWKKFLVFRFSFVLVFLQTMLICSVECFYIFFQGLIQQKKLTIVTPNFSIWTLYANKFSWDLVWITWSDNTKHSWRLQLTPLFPMHLFFTP